jgi:hypothetical protein
MSSGTRCVPAWWSVPSTGDRQQSTTAAALHAQGTAHAERGQHSAGWE